MPGYILHQTAERDVVNRLLTVLEAHLSDTLDTLWNRSGNYTGSDAALDYDFYEGIYLPDPTQKYRQTGPTTQQQQDVGEPALYVGPTGDAVPTGQKGNAATYGAIWEVVQEFTVTIIFGRGGSRTVTDTILGRPLREEEHVRERAVYYLGGLVEVVNARAPAGDFPEVHSITPLGRQAAQVEFELNSGSYPAFGVAAFSFNVTNFQAFPRRNYS